MRNLPLDVLPSLETLEVFQNKIYLRQFSQKYLCKNFKIILLDINLKLIDMLIRGD
jgi:hypothetical protein